VRAFYCLVAGATAAAAAASKWYRAVEFCLSVEHCRGA